MESKPDILKELKGLGNELADALKQIRASDEFHELGKDVTTGIKKISSSLARSLKAAKDSEQTSKLKKRLTRVAKAGAHQGKVEAERARKAAVTGIRQVRSSVRDLTEKLRKRKNGRKSGD